MNQLSLFYFSLLPLCFTIAVVSERLLLPMLCRLAKQPIYTDGPRWHLKKSGTPTMGGIAAVIAVTISAVCGIVLLAGQKRTDAAAHLLLLLFFCLSNALVGYIDDRKKLAHAHNEDGLRPKEKLLLQSVIAIVFLYLRTALCGRPTHLSFSSVNIELGFFYYPLMLFLLLGIINCANLTDGVDGLAASVAFAIGISLFYLCRNESVEGSVLSIGLVGASLGFLCFNLHPAKVFMGDTGSLFFGALCCSVLFSIENPLLILLFGGVYVIEGFSVVLQVLFYKVKHKRIFLMAPLHHHFEKKGWSENKIAISAILMTLFFSMIGALVWRL